jgi:hypothetical protein
MVTLPVSTPIQIQAVITQCESWLSDQSFDDPARTKIVSGGVCFNGHIQKGDDATFRAALAQLPDNQPRIAVVRSSGGDTDTGLSMGEALLDRPATVVASQICGSSCANYLLAAGQTKIVWKDTLLLYHGGITLDFLESTAAQTREQIMAQAAQNPQLFPDAETLIDHSIEETRQQLTTIVARQDAFLARSGISQTFFRWMDLFNHMGEAERTTHCPVPPHMMVYAPTRLASFGFRIDVYDGPTSQTEVDRLAAAYHLKNPLCYWQEQAGGL